MENQKRKERALTQENCPVELSIKLDKGRGVWFVDNFVDEHNHRLASPDKIAYL